MTASTLDQYLTALPADRRAAISAVRKVINENLPDGYEESMQFGMIGWCLVRFKCGVSVPPFYFSLSPFYVLRQGAPPSF